MSIFHAASADTPRWDGTRILFDLDEQGERISCAISRGALEDIGDKRLFKTTDIMACFTRSRARIEAIAREKWQARPTGTFGRLSVWADDILEMPAEAAAGQI